MYTNEYRVARWSLVRESFLAPTPSGNPFPLPPEEIPAEKRARKDSRTSRLCGIALCLLGSIWLGCNRSNVPTTQPAASGDDFRVAVVVPGSTADQGWNHSAKEGAVLIAAELKLAHPVSFIEDVEASRRKAVLRDYGRDGYQLVICHGYEFHQVVKEIAAEFPKTAFVISGYDQPDDHFGSIVYQLGEAAYLCGVIAAKVTDTHCVGFIAAQEVPPVVLCYQGFRNGFLAADSTGTVRPPVYIEGARPWEDSAAAKIKTQAVLRVTEPAPIDVLFQNADAASRGVFEAVQEHGGRTFVFGANRDQNSNTATDKVLASAVIHVDRAFVHVAREVHEGRYHPRVISETIASGGIECVPSPRLNLLVGDERAKMVRDAVDEARTGIVNGVINATHTQETNR